MFNMSLFVRKEQETDDTNDEELAPNSNIHERVLNLFKEDKVELLPKLLVDVPELLNKKDIHGVTFTHAAVAYRSVNLIRHLFLLDAKFKTVKTTLGRTLILHEIARSLSKSSDTKFEIISFLIEQNCDVNCPDKWGTTPLHAAVSTCDERLCSLLIENGANINAQDYSACTPLHTAVRTGNIEIVSLLLYYNASVNEVDYYSYAPIHEAVYLDLIDVAELLLDYVDTQNDFNAEKLLSIALENESPFTLKILNAGINWESLSLYSICDILIAYDGTYHYSSLEWAWCLLSWGATVNAKAIEILYSFKNFSQEIEVIFSSEVPIKRSSVRDSFINTLVYNDTLKTNSLSGKEFYAPVHDRVVPSLMQLARDECRKVIFNKYQKGVNFKAYNVIMGLHIPKLLKDILVLKEPIYKIDTKSMSEDSNIETMSEDNNIEPLSEDNNIEPLSEDSNIEPMSEDSYIETISEDSDMD